LLLPAILDSSALELAELCARLADLEKSVGCNPRNSSMPPSAEGFSKPTSPSRAERHSAGRKQSKSPAALRKYLAQAADSDLVVFHAPPSCSSHGEVLEAGEVVSTERRQVFELPKIRLVGTEHVVERRPFRYGC